MTSMKRVCEQFFKFGARSRAGKFQSLLGINLKQDGGPTELLSIDNKTSVVSTRVAPWLCLEDGRICLSSVIAVFDQISTFAGTVPWDPKWRPGQSIMLQADAHKPLDVGAGDEVLFVSHEKRHGRVISFVDGEMQNSKGETLAYLRHIKYQPMGLHFDILGHPAMRPLTHIGFDAYMAPMKVAELEMPQTWKQVFNPENVKTSDGSISGEFKVDVWHGNPVGNLQGGSRAQLQTQIARKALIGEANPGVPIKHYHSNFLGGVPVKPGKQSTVKAEARFSEYGEAGYRQSEITLSHKNKPVVLSNIVWGDPA